MAEQKISSFNFSNFAAQLGGVVQQNQFAAFITLPPSLSSLFPDADQFSKKIGFSISATSLPPSTIGEIEIPFRSKKFRIPGDRESGGSWSVTCRYDIGNICHNVFERWSDSIVGNVEHDSALDGEDILQLMGTGELHQLTRNSRIVKSWSLSNIWLSEIGELSYSWDSDNAIVEMDATFVFQHVESPVTRNNTISETKLLSGQLAFT